MLKIFCSRGFSVVKSRNNSADAWDPSDWEAAGVPNRCLSAANSCLYGLTKAAVLTAGYASAIGFLHTGKPLSFVYDIADLYKMDTVVREAFRVPVWRRRASSTYRSNARG